MPLPNPGLPISQAVAVLFQMTFVILFLVSGAHEIFFRIFDVGYEIFPIGTLPDLGVFAEGLMEASSMMFYFALRLAAPVLAAFVAMSVTLGVLARVLPEMNVLLVSFPLRIGLGLIMAAAIMPSLQSFVGEMVLWLESQVGV